MGRRIEVELTSTRDDGSWTWRAAGARKPKGELDGALVYEGASVGDVMKVEAEFHVDGIEITEVFAPKKKKERTNLLELKSRPLRDDELVTTQRVSRDDRRGNRKGGNRDDKRRRGGSGGDSRSNRGERKQRPEPDARPKPKRLRPRRAHREALLAEVGEEYRPIVEQLIKDGMPGVRAAIERQNAEATEAGKPTIDPAPILSIAEKNLHKARLAEWRDRADAALALVDELDLRDLRSVVVASNDIARDPESRELADKLKSSLDARVESDHAAWLEDLQSAIGDGRVVRALRLSSRPVKAGAPLPPELASTLAGQASEALAADVGQERWATVLDALAFSPVRGAVTPQGVPSEAKEPLLEAVKRLSDRLPAIAALFGIDPAAVPKSARRRRSPRRDKGAGDNQAKGAKKPTGQAPGAEKPAAPEATADVETPAETPAAPEATADVETPAETPAATEATADVETPAETPAAPEATADVETPAETPAAPEATADVETPAETPAAPEATADVETPTEA